MLQCAALDGSYIAENTPEILDKILNPDNLGITDVPKDLPGIIGLNLDTGLVIIRKSENFTVSMKIGKYLKIVGKSEEIQRDYSNKLKSNLVLYKGLKLTITETSDEAERVYRNGPHSCMKNSATKARAYATEDVGIAYVEIGGRVIARSVVSKTNMEYTVIYGNSLLLGTLLGENGYSQDDEALRDCKILKISDTNISGKESIRCPYIDGDYTDIIIEGEYLVIVEEGDYIGDSESFYLERKNKCAECQEGLGENEIYYSEYEERELCHNCYDDRHVLIGMEHYNIYDYGSVVKLESTREYVLTIDTVYSDYHNKDLLWEDSMYSDYDDDYFEIDEVVYAQIDEHSKENCHKENCEEYCGVWVLEDYMNEYVQLKLELEDE